VSFAEGLANRAAEGESLAEVPIRSIRITGQLGRPRGVTGCAHSRVVMTVDRGEVRVPVAIVERERPHRVLAGRRQLAAGEQCRPQRVMRLDEVLGLTGALGEGE
jgi:hypothetical protein